ncbi:MAG: DUF7309 domain-containing protein [Desulfatiglandales bacterium]
MKFEEPDQSHWKVLFEGASRLKKLAPWEWMNERDIFGVKNPDGGEIGFVSIMGAGGEHFAMGLYLGPEGLNGFWELQQQEGLIPPDLLFETPQLQVSFEDRQGLEPHDYRIIKDLGLRFRGRNAWPKFQSFRPGYWPWKIDRREAVFLGHALEQACEVALMVREEPGKLEQADRDSYLLRVPKGRVQGLRWEEQILKPPIPGSRSLRIDMDPEALGGLHEMPLKKDEIELDLFMIPASIGAKGERPACAYLLLLVHGRTGNILGFEPMTADPDLDAMRGQIPLMMVWHLKELGYRPREISVQNELLFALLQTFTEKLDIRVKKKRSLKYLDMAKDALIDQFEGGIAPFLI